MRKRYKKNNVLIAGIGGASLGTEILKSLKLAGRYNIFGADISPYAYGLYDDGLTKAHVVRREKYIQDILEICEKEEIDAVIPGGEEPLFLLNQNRDLFEKNNVLLAMNSAEVIELCTDKIKTFEYLEKKGFPVPSTKLVENPKDLKNFHYPCIVKPSTGSGGSVFVYLAEDEKEALFFVSYLRRINLKAIVQEYIPSEEGEYTVGILHLPNGELVGSIALKRLFHAKLSVLIKTKDKIISSGYSQGLIDDFKQIREQAEKIAEALNSRGPMNIQGRLKNGIFYPFEINPRFSATTYLRAMAGFNEVDIFLQFLFTGKKIIPKKIKYGYYFRSLEEKFVGIKKLKIYDLDKK
jgi:carbamoyl-phosphate synthase large subunit